MDEVIKREEATITARELKVCQIHLKKGNIFSCLVCFEGVLKKMLSAEMLPSDSNQLNADINTFQRDLAASKIFKDVYGPVTFRDDDRETALSLVRQLIEKKNEGIRALLNLEHTVGSAEDITAAKVQQIKLLIEKGDYAEAQELIGEDEAIMNALLDEYNTAGITFRQSGHYDEAINAFHKAIVVLPHDEGLYYNVARAFVEKKQWKAAEEAMAQAIKINTEFTEGKALLSFIRKQQRPDKIRRPLPGQSDGTVHSVRRPGRGLT